jgi:hypothetical protein
MKSVEEITQELIEEIIVSLSQYKSCRYVVERYIVSLKQLTIAIYPIESRKGKYVTFRTVKYMQLPTRWENAVFQLATKSECLDFLKSVDIKVVDDIPHLFYAQLPTSRVNIVFHSVRISETSPWDEEEI